MLRLFVQLPNLKRCRLFSSFFLFLHLFLLFIRLGGSLLYFFLFFIRHDNTCLPNNRREHTRIDTYQVYLSGLRNARGLRLPRQPTSTGTLSPDVFTRTHKFPYCHPECNEGSRCLTS